MNILKARITSVETADGLTLVRATAGNIVLHALVLEPAAAPSFLQTGDPVRLAFKETEVIIAKGDKLSISIRNQVQCEIQKIKTGMVLSELTLRILDSDGEEPAPGEPNHGTAEKAVEIRSVITSAACEELALREKDRIVALIKTNEVSLLTKD